MRLHQNAPSLNGSNPHSRLYRPASKLCPSAGRYYFKSTRQAAKANDAPRRFVLQPGSLPEEVRLAADMGRLRGWAAAAEQRGRGRHAGVARGEAAELEDFADVCLAVDGRLFR